MNTIKTINGTSYSRAKHEINCVVSVAVQNLLDCGTILESPEYANEMSVLENFEHKVFKNYVHTKDKKRTDENSLEFLRLSQEILGDMGNDYKTILSFLFYYLNEAEPKRQKELNTPNGLRLKKAVSSLIKKLQIEPSKYVEYAV